MMTSILLVEGDTDRSFYRTILRKINLSHVEVNPPRTYGQPNTVTTFPALIPILTQQMASGQVERLGIVADADHTSGGGIDSRWDSLREIFDSEGFNVPSKPPKQPYRGSQLRHRDGLPDVGLWLMPDHQSNGMLEDFIMASGTCTPEQQRLRDCAEDSWKKIPKDLVLFGELHHSKVTLYTWIAWQKRPGLGLGVVAGEPLLDAQSASYKGFIKWLSVTFA